MAEKSPMIMEIDRRVIRSALQTLADNLKEGGNTSLFIKLSGETIGDPQLPEWIRLQLQEHELPSDAIIFEIPESVAVNKPNETLAFTKAVQAFGCLLAIEHFGYANKPDIIKGLSVDFLKIDGSLINNLASSKSKQEKVRSIVDFSRSTNTLCIAEHVDDAQCLVMLWKYNIDYIQGNLIKEPGKELTHDFEDEAALAGLIEIE
jgi:EAL domain-containing protein (putative c-di-GMP-specific phosphodiesterase class I)